MPDILTGDYLGRDAIEPYSTPFVKQSDAHKPRSMAELLEMAYYYAMTDATVAPIIGKLAAYPLTDVSLAVENDAMADRMREFFLQELGLLAFAQEVGLEYYGYGNSIVSIMFPFKRFLRCTHCQKKTPINRVNWHWKKFRFVAQCSSDACAGARRIHKPFDVYIRDKSGIKLKKWPLGLIDITWSEATQSATYRFTVSRVDDQLIRRGDRRTLETCPWEYVEAVEKRRRIILDPSNLFHLARNWLSHPRIPTGWGVPAILPAFDSLHMKKQLEKSREVLAKEQIVPLDVLYPEAGGAGGTDPLSELNLGVWRDRVEQEIKEHKRDPGRKAVMPIPIGWKRIGGVQGQQNIVQDLEYEDGQIVAGTGAFRELIYGGANFSSSSVVVRLMENEFSNHTNLITRLIQYFVIDRITAFMRWPRVTAKIKPMRMADDILQKQFLNNMLVNGHMDRQTAFEDMGFDIHSIHVRQQEDVKRRAEIMKAEAVAKANADGAAMEAMAIWNARAQLAGMEAQGQLQRDMVESGQLQGAVPMDVGVHEDEAADMISRIMSSTTDPENMRYHLSDLGAQRPTLHQKVVERMMGGGSHMSIEKQPAEKPPQSRAAAV